MGVRTVLITGATGHIGRDLCHRLAGSFEVHAGVRRPVEGFSNPVMCQLRDLNSVLTAVQGVDAVIHLAAQSWEADVHKLMIPDNITGCYNIFEAARQAGVGRVVFASTHHVVRRYLEEGMRVGEDVSVRPNTFYAVTKVFGEALGRYYTEMHGLSVICARIGKFLPPDQVVPVSIEFPERLWQSRALWISPRDMAQFMTRCLTVEGITYEVLNCTSRNTRELMDLSRAREVLGYAPEDDAEVLLRAGGLV
jgi:uronate dehydrogenase